LTALVDFLAFAALGFAVVVISAFHQFVILL